MSKQLSKRDERPHAMLTQTQREFLKGDREYTGDHAKQQRYEMRKSIRERYHHTLQDLELLAECWDEIPASHQEAMNSVDARRAIRSFLKISETGFETSVDKEDIELAINGLESYLELLEEVDNG